MFQRAGLVAVVGLLGSGCLIVNNKGATTGDVRVAWSFNGQTACDAAGVSQVQITLTSNSSTVASLGPSMAACSAHAFTISHVKDGDYTLQLDGVNSTNAIVYSASRTLVVTAGNTTDLGTLDLARLLGELRVDWQFQMASPPAAPTRDCAAAQVDDVQVVIMDTSGSTTAVFNDVTACLQGPASVVNLANGNYTVSLYALHYTNMVPSTLYLVENIPFTIANGQTLDLGVHTLTRQSSDLSVDWTFAVVGTPSPSTDCARAGVDDVQVVITANGAAQAIYNDVTPCLNGPAHITTLPAGDYSVSLYGLHYYSMVPYTLYQVTGIPFTLAAGQALPLGTQVLAIQAANFGNLNVSWSLPAGVTCQGLALPQGKLNVAIYRGTATTAEDSFLADCTAPNALRNTFVPGDWRVVVTATGANATYVGQLVQNVAPSQTVNLPVVLAHQ